MSSPRSSSTLVRLTVLVVGLLLSGAVTSAAVATDDPSASPSPGAAATSDPGDTGTSSPQSEPTEAPTSPETTTSTPAPSSRALQRSAVAPIPSFCRIPPPGTSTVSDGTYFNYPFGGSAASNNIRYMVLRAINSTPGCENVDTATGTYSRNSIRIAAYSLNDNTTVDALIKAVQRGAVVQVVSDSHNISGDPATQSPSFKRLIRTLNYNTHDSSFAKVCSRSCRGTAGNHHYKMYLFSHTGSKHSVTMAGSANLTMKAAGGQWNHLDVYTSAPTWVKYSQMFAELVRDQPATGVYRDYLTGAVRTWFFPRPGTKSYNDPMVQALNNVSCSGSAYNNGRTSVRIGMYAWYEERGVWMAAAVRRLWNAGCDVAIEYAVMGNTVKQILYSPAGRGRIPMRQVATYYRDGSVADYDHQKYITVIGRYAGNSSSAITWTGTTNWSNLGLYSDDLTQVWSQSFSRAAAYRAAFYRVWRGPHVRVPSPTSALSVKIDLGGPNFRGFENN